MAELSTNSLCSHAGAFKDHASALNSLAGRRLTFHLYLFVLLLVIRTIEMYFGLRNIGVHFASFDHARREKWRVMKGWAKKE